MHLEANERTYKADKLLRIEVFNGYDFMDNPGQIKYTICTYEEKLGFDEISGNPILNSDGTQAYTIFKTPIKSEIIDLTSEIVNQWGADDEIIFDFIKDYLDGKAEGK